MLLCLRDWLVAVGVVLLCFVWFVAVCFDCLRLFN